ncbi:MAG TPA: GGDEF domain-containing protein [Solirubrobacterales bacterium]|nr:GGDEF domain-containing protein [Solirubrobacterales bacterium]
MATETPTRDGMEAGIGKLARELFADAAQRLADEFGSVTASAVGTLWDESAPAPGIAPAPSAPPTPSAGEHPSLYRPGQLRRRLDQLLECQRRYQQRFALVVFDVEGPGARTDEAGDRQTALAVVGAALGESTRLVDETFRLEEDALCVLAPGQDTIGGVQMAERLLDQLDQLERAGGLRIGISAGVVACPDHGSDADGLLHKADEAMWRARSVGQPVGVGVLQDR